MLRSVLSRAMLLTVAILLLFANVQATDVVLTHQGRLLDSADEPVTGPIDITFRIFDVPTGGVPLWTELHAAVAVSDGLFTTTLGSITPMSSDVLASVSSTQPRWLEVEISGSPIVPRVLLGSTPSSAVSTRVLGDIQTEPGILTVSNGSGTKGVVTRASDTNNGIAIDEEGVQLFAINSHNSPGDSHVSMSVGDLTGDGRADLVCTSDSVKSSWTFVEAGSGSSGGVELTSRAAGSNWGAFRTNTGGDLVRSSNETDDNGASSILSGTGVDNGATAMMRATMDSAVSILVSEGNGPLGTATARLTAVATFEDRTTSDMTFDSNGDGNPESSVHQESRPGGATMKAIQTKGTGAIALTRMDANDSGSVVIEHDSDGDGVAQTHVGCTAQADVGYTQMVHNSGSSSSSYLGSCDATGTRSVLEATSSGVGGGSSQRYTAQCTMTDGSSSDLTYDASDDGAPETSVTLQAKDQFGNVRIRFDPDGNGVTDHLVTMDGSNFGSHVSLVSLGGLPPTPTDSAAIEMETNSSSSKMAIKTKGTGAQRSQLIATATMADGCDLALTNDSDADGTSNTTITVRAQDTFGNMVLSSDSDDDGVSEYSSELRSEPVGVSFTLFDAEGDPASIDFTVGNDRPQITVTQVGIDRCIVNPDSGIQLSNSSAVKTVDIHDSGIIYVAGGMEIGMTGGSHHIDVAGGAYCDGTNWVNASDKNAKENFENVNGEELLEKIAQLDITKWNYKGDNDAQHIGPTAQDFKKTFGVGADDKSISTIDPSGIALAAIKELYAQLQAKDNEMKELREEMAKLKKEFSKKK